MIASRNRKAANTCNGCGKASYLTRDAAKAQRRRLGMAADQRPYRCPVNPSYWHLGHLAPEIIAGERSRDVYSMDELEAWARRVVVTRARRRCEVCGGKGIEYSHRQRRSIEAHRWCPCNGVLACRSCHARMHATPTWARGEGLHVSIYTEVPGAIPVHLSVGWAILDCDGGGEVIAPNMVVVEHGIPRVLGPGEPNQ